MRSIYAVESTFSSRDHSRGLYANLDFVRAPQWDKNDSFWNFMRARDIGFVILNDRLRGDERFGNDPQFQQFETDTDLTDFERISVTNTGVVMVIRKSLLAARGRP